MSARAACNCTIVPPSVSGAVALALGAHALPATAAARRARRRLWELPAKHHCVLLGAAFDARDLRQMFRRGGYADWQSATDYELHSSAVCFARERNDFSALAQKRLEAHFRPAVHSMSAAATGDDIVRLWQHLVEQGDPVGAYWAARLASMPEVAAPRLSDLAGQRVLCVGGKASLVAHYRALVEEARGEFLHHDGGVEDHVARLPAMLAAAGPVVCLAGDCSHATYRIAKRYCKAKGKRCALVGSSGVTALARCIEGLGLKEGEQGWNGRRSHSQRFLLTARGSSREFSSTSRAT